MLCHQKSSDKCSNSVDEWQARQAIASLTADVELGGGRREGGVTGPVLNLSNFNALTENCTLNSQETVFQDFFLTGTGSPAVRFERQSEAVFFFLLQETTVLKQAGWKPSALDACVHRFLTRRKEIAGGLCSMLMFCWEETVLRIDRL